MITRCVLIAGFALFSLASSVEAQEGGEESHAARVLAEAQRLYLDGVFDEALLRLEELLASDGLATDDRLVALELVGCIQLILGNDQGARTVLVELVEIDPFYRLREPTGAPRFRRFFEEVRQESAYEVRPRDDVTLEVDLPRQGRAGEPVDVGVRLRAPTGAVSSVVALIRAPGEQGFTPTASFTRSPGGYSGTLVLHRAGQYEIYVDARDADGVAVARRGSPHEPLLLEIARAEHASAPEPERRPEPRRRRRGWIWGVVAGTTVAVVVGVVLGVVLSPEPLEGDLPPGRVELE